MDNVCICCGEVIPEGRLVCPMCMLSTVSDDDIEDDEESEVL